MKPDMAVALATWMLEHLSLGRDHESLSGDLLEELGAGRSTGWFLRQVSIAIGVGVCESIREYIAPLIFSASWSILFPLWRFMGQTHFIHPDRWVPLGWPYSTMMYLAEGIIPAVTFVWLGLLVYLLVLLRLRRLSELSTFRILMGLSTSLNVLLSATLGLFYYLKSPVINVQYVASQGFYSVFHISSINVPLTFSLLAAILSLMPHTPRIARRRRSPHTNSSIPLRSLEHL